MNLRDMIPLDDLHWYDEDDQFVPLRPEEYDKLIIACHTSRFRENFKNFENTLRLVRWVEEIRIGELLIKGLLSGRLGIVFEEGMTEPTFYVNTDEESDEYSDACKVIK